MKDFTLEDAMNGFSKLRNNALGDALEYMKEVEAWGGGVSRYFTACAASGLPPPTVSEEAGFFKVVFWRRAKDAKAIDGTSVPTIETTAKTTTKTTVKTTVKSAVKTTARTTGKVALQESQGRAGLSVWNMINKNPTIAISALASATGLTCDGVRYHIRKLKTAGRLKRIGGTNGGRWEVLK